jgi:heat shock protein HtpX
MMAVSRTQTFYAQESANRRQSILLVLLLMALLGALGGAIGYAWGNGSIPFTLLTIAIAVGVAFVLSLFSYYSGDSLVLAVSGAKEVTADQAPQLFNVVQELSIAANIPPPRVYIIDDSAPNAFATGRDPKHSSIAITTGLLGKLDREELQGVIGHEMSHIRNLDIRFSLLVAVLVGSIALMSDFFLRATFWGGVRRGRGRGSSEGGGLVIVVYVIAIALAIIAPFVAALVQLAVSRQREYLADASSVELTRNPSGLERALAAIAGDQEALEVANRATQHLYFVNPIKKWENRSSGLFSTHPPILDRINRLRALTGEQPLDPATAGALSGLD